MRLGGPILTDTLDYGAYLAEVVRQGYRAAACPAGITIDEMDKIGRIKRIYREADVVISEVGVWVNPLEPNLQQRRTNIKLISEGLALADELDAKCAVSCVGSFAPLFYQAHPDNFTDECFEAVVEWVRKVIDRVKPRRAKMALEMSPWTLLDGPDIYLKLIRAIDRPGLAVHLDPVNAITDPHKYFSNTQFLNYCFDLLGEWIVCCHAKDILKDEDPATVSMKEVAPGKGVLDYRTFLARCEQISPDIPILMEHLNTAQEYAKAADYIRGIACGIGIKV